MLEANDLLLEILMNSKFSRLAQIAMDFSCIKMNQFHYRHMKQKEVKPMEY